MKRWVISVIALGAIVSCTTVGPRTGEIIQASDAKVLSSAQPTSSASKFAIVEADRDVAFIWRQYEATRGAFFSDTGPGRVAIQSGDILSISLVSYDDVGFVDYTNAAISPLSTTTLPRQQVTEQGTINVPPLGRMRVAGLTIPDLEARLDEELGQLLVDPSIVIEMRQRNGALVSLIGNVGNPGSYPYSSGDTRILDLINIAGGASSDIQGLEVMMSRHGETRRVALADIYNNDSLNVHVRPGDVISVEPRDNSVVILGATGSNEEVQFDQTTVPLSNVLGEIGGIANRRADPRGIFLYRPTPRRLAEMLGLDTSTFPGEEILTVYRFDLTRPESFFTVTDFELRDGDLVYVANSRYEEIDAALDIFADSILRPAQIAVAIDRR